MRSLPRCVTTRAFIFTLLSPCPQDNLDLQGNVTMRTFIFTVFSSLSSSLRLGLWIVIDLAAVLEGKRLDIWNISRNSVGLSGTNIRTGYGQLSWPRIAFRNRNHGLPIRNMANCRGPGSHSRTGSIGHHQQIAPSPYMLHHHPSKHNPHHWPVTNPCSSIRIVFRSPKN